MLESHSECLRNGRSGPYCDCAKHQDGLFVWFKKLHVRRKTGRSWVGSGSDTLVIFIHYGEVSNSNLKYSEKSWDCTITNHPLVQQKGPHALS